MYRRIKKTAVIFVVILVVLSSSLSVFAVANVSSDNKQVTIDNMIYTAISASRCQTDMTGYKYYDLQATSYGEKKSGYTYDAPAFVAWADVNNSDVYWQGNNNYYFTYVVDFDFSQYTSSEYISFSFDVLLVNEANSDALVFFEYNRGFYSLDDDSVQPYTVSGQVIKVKTEGFQSSKRWRGEFHFKLQGESNYKNHIEIRIANFTVDSKTAQQYEEEFASSSGNDNIDALTEAIPDVGIDEVLQSFDKLTKSMMTNETDCVIKFPAIAIPAIEPYFNKVELLSAQDIDMSTYIQMMPETILLLLQSLLTVALILYCFKELYGWISYALTLKGGSSNE